MRAVHFKRERERERGRVCVRTHERERESGAAGCKWESPKVISSPRTRILSGAECVGVEEEAGLEIFANFRRGILGKKARPRRK